MSEENRTTYSFGEIIRRERKKMGMTLNAMSEFLGENADGDASIAPSYLNRLETGDRDNPTFKLVCGIVSKLGLDLNEVFKAFGYENLIQGLDDKKYDDIEMIIRLANIKAPIKKLKNGHIVYDYISDPEKEILIDIFKKVFEYSVADSGTKLNKIIAEIIELVGQYKDIMIEKAGNIEYDRQVTISGEKFFVYICDNVKEEIVRFQKTEDDVIMELCSLGDKIYELYEPFYIEIDGNRGTILKIERDHNRIRVLDIGKMV